MLLWEQRSLACRLALAGDRPQVPLAVALGRVRKAFVCRDLPNVDRLLASNTVTFRRALNVEAGCGIGVGVATGLGLCGTPGQVIAKTIAASARADTTRFAVRAAGRRISLIPPWTCVRQPIESSAA